MAWLHRNDPDWRTAWGYSFRFGKHHWSPDQLHPLKYSYDKLADDCLDVLSPPELEKEKQAPSVLKRDLYALLRDQAGENEKLGQLWTEVNTVPVWVDWDQISRGQDVFYRYGGPALTALAYLSLLGGMGAARVAETLARTGGFGAKVARRRMYETTQHVLQVTNSLSSVQPGGAGHISSIKVRLLHAAVRRRILSLEKQKPGYFNVEELGIPINDLDSIATILTFSATLIWIGFPRQGIFLRSQEIKDYLALWRLVAHYVGTPTDCFETPEKAKAMLESLLSTEICPTPTSQKLSRNIILSLQGQPPTYASYEFLAASARWLNGSELADALDLKWTGWYYDALVAGQCIFFMALCYTNRSIPYLDRRKIKALKRIFYAVIVENKTHGLGAETNFEFKYIPDFHTQTEGGKLERSGLKEAGLERRNLRTLVVAMTVLVAVACVGVRFTWGLVLRGF